MCVCECECVCVSVCAYVCVCVQMLNNAFLSKKKQFHCTNNDMVAQQLK